MWKAMNITDYPIQVSKVGSVLNQRVTRSITDEKLLEKGKTALSQATFINDASKAWNKAPESIKKCQNLWSAKIEIKKFVITLPV